MKIAFLTLGCKLNYAETSTYERGFKEEGLEVVPWEEKADVYLINTCSVTERAEAKCRNIIRKMHRTSPRAKLIITGCYAQLRRDALHAIDGVALVFGATEKTRVVSDTLALLRAEQAAKENTGPASVLGEIRPRLAAAGNDPHPLPDKGDKAEILPAYSSDERTRSFLKVQDGCNNFCAYCTVPYARGLSRNIPIADVIAQAKSIAATGVKEIVVTGVNTGDFGRTTGESFLELLKRLNDVEGIERYRISSIEPNLITEEIVDWIASGTKFQPHFHIPLQSGSDAMLKRVGRKYTTGFFAERIEYIREKMDPAETGDGSPSRSSARTGRKTQGASGHSSAGKPYVFFGIDVIAGLPGETEDLFEETCSFLKDRIKPAFIHIFPYSRRPGTMAAGWKDQVKDSVKTERVARLEGLCATLHDGFIAKNRGRRSQVLWESDVKDGIMGGYSGNYIRIERPWDPHKVNTIEDIIL